MQKPSFLIAFSSDRSEAMGVSFLDQYEDNKVGKWKGHYVDYGAVCKVLAEARDVGAAYENLAKTRPDVAAEFELLAEGASLSSSGGLGPEESEYLMAALGGGYGSGSGGGRDVEADGGANMDSRQAFKAQLAQRRLAIDAIAERVKAALLAERDKAAKFYVKEVAVLEHRLDLLIKTVQGNYEMQPDPEKRKNRRDTFILTKSARTLLGERDDVHVVIDEEDDVTGNAVSVNSVVNEMASIKRALVDLNRQTQLLYNFFIMNYSALANLVKRFNTAVPRHEIELRDIMPEHYDGRKTIALTDRIVKVYAKWFCGNDARQANAQMLSKKGDILDMDWSQLRLGYRLGICFTLMIWLCFDCLWNLFSEGQVTLGGRSAFPVFRACGGLLLWHWCWAGATFVWRRYRINYIYLFDFNPQIVQDPATLFDECVDETIVLLVTLILYYKTSTHAMPEWFPPGIYPAFLVLYTIWHFIFPLKQRRPLWSAMARVCRAPLTSPSFFETYVADVFTSMVKILLDLLWTICFIISGDFLITETVDKNANDSRHEWQHSKWYKQYLVTIICLFPLYIRLMQCLRKYNDTSDRIPNLPNAFKYTLSQVVTLFGAFFPVLNLRCHNSSQCTHMSGFQMVWLAIFIFSSTYSWVWDIYMDWGLGRRGYSWLGPRLMFPSVFHYYGVMAADLVLRFMWMQSLIPPSSGAHFELPAYLTFMNMTLELVRRTLWSFFRLENEHRARTKHYEEPDVNFVPLHFTTAQSHKYKRHKERVGKRVLVEVLAVGIAVFVICMLVVIAAQKQARLAQEQEL